MWAAELDSAFPVADDVVRVLSRSELERAQRFARPALRRRYVAAHAFVRLLLADHLDARPETIAFVYSDHGKPSIDGAAIRFNLAHSDGVALVGVGVDCELGVDVERVRPLEVESLASGACSTVEQARLAASPADERPAIFLRLWTAKEAYLKATGAGLTVPPATIDAAAIIDRSPVALGEAHLVSFAPVSGYVAAVAVLGDDTIAPP